MYLTVQMSLPEGADEEIERLLARQTCPVHPGTTLDFEGDECAMCKLDERHAPLCPCVACHNRRASQRPASGWVQRALDHELPAKVLR